MMIDTHAHVAGDEFPDVVDVLARAREAGVEAIVVVGADQHLEGARRAIALVEDPPAPAPSLHAAVAVHPHDAARMSDADFEEIAALAARPSVAAVGETGLDYHYRHSPPAEQQRAMRRFAGLARRLGKPLVVHVRDAHEDARRILDEEGAAAGAIVHCFTGTAADAEAYLARGCFVSLSGIVTFKGAGELRRVAALVPDERLLVETDCPYLAPVPLRGKRNEPAFVAHTVRAVAEARGRPPAEVAAAAARAARAAFRLPPA